MSVIFFFFAIDETNGGIYFCIYSALPSDEDRKRYLHLIALMLPKSHRDTMEVLFVFLKWVASFAHMDAETGSKMDLGNLATVICPSILYSRGQNAMRDETFSSVRVVTSLLENQDEFFTVPEEFLPILHDQEYFANSLDLPSKEFLKKCDTYMRLKGGARSMPGTPYMHPQPNGIQQQRYPPINSPTPERPPPPGGLFGAPPSNSDRNMRMQQNIPQGTESYQPPGSPSIPQGMPIQMQMQMQQQNQGMVQNMQRNPQMDDWNPSPPIPRPTNNNSNSYSPSSQPPSFVGPPSRSPAEVAQPQGQPYGSTVNGYSPAAQNMLNGNQRS